jgi:hypothetical protein
VLQVRHTAEREREGERKRSNSFKVAQKQLSALIGSYVIISTEGDPKSAAVMRIVRSSTETLNRASKGKKG